MAGLESQLRQAAEATSNVHVEIGLRIRSTLAHLFMSEGRTGEALEITRSLGEHVDVAGVLEAFDLGQRHARHEIDLAGEQRRNLAGLLGDHLVDDAIDLGAAGPVVVPGFEHVAVALGEFDQPVGSGADRVTSELLLADLFEVLGRKDLATVEADVVEGVGVNFIGDDVEGQLVDHDHLVDELPLRVHQEILTGHDPIEVPLDGRGVEHLAVLEGVVRPQVEAPGQVVNRLVEVRPRACGALRGG